MPITYRRNFRRKQSVYSLPRLENMTRAEDLKAREGDKSEWRKLYYKHQQQYIRRRLEAIKYLQEVINKVGCARQSLTNWIDTAYS